MHFIFMLLLLILLLLLLLLLLSLLLLVFNIYVQAVVITIISSFRRVITNDQRLAEYSCLYMSNTFLSIFAVSSKALFSLLQHCMLCLAFPSTYQILQKHSKGPYHYRDNFYISQFSQSSYLFYNLPIFFQILVLFYFFPFLFPLLLHQLIQQYQ